MIWHVHASAFIAYLESIGFSRVGQTATHILFTRGSRAVFVRRSATLTQNEVDLVCDAADLDPPRFDTFFGD